MIKNMRKFGLLVVLLFSARSFANADRYYSCNLVLETKDANDGWSIEASPRKKFGPVPTSRATMTGVITFKDYSGTIDIIVAQPLVGKVLLRVQKVGQSVPTSYSYTSSFAKNIEIGSELNDEKIVRMRCVQE